MNVGFIGAGQMGGAMIQGLLRAKAVAPSELYVKGGSSGTAEKLQKKLKFQLVTDYETFKQCKVIFIATGAGIVLKVLGEMAPFLSSETLVISVAAGHTIAEAQQALGDGLHVVHAIPNTPVSVNEGMIGVAYPDTLPNEIKGTALEMLQTLGKVAEVPEALLGTVGTVAGCSPAFVDVFMEALGDAAVMEGLPRGLSYELIAQMVLGSAKLALETGAHPAALKDEVTSPGGSTIRGVAALEKNGFRYAVIDAIKQANRG